MGCGASKVAPAINEATSLPDLQSHIKRYEQAVKRAGTAQEKEDLNSRIAAAKVLAAAKAEIVDAIKPYSGVKSAIALRDDAAVLKRVKARAVSAGAFGGREAAALEQCIAAKEADAVLLDTMVAVAAIQVDSGMAIAELQTFMSERMEPCLMHGSHSRGQGDTPEAAALKKRLAEVKVRAFVAHSACDRARAPPRLLSVRSRNCYAILLHHISSSKPGR